MCIRDSFQGQDTIAGIDRHDLRRVKLSFPEVIASVAARYRLNQAPGDLLGVREDKLNSANLRPDHCFRSNKKAIEFIREYGLLF